MDEKGYVLGNLDCTIIAQKPKLSPHKVACGGAGRGGAQAHGAGLWGLRQSQAGGAGYQAFVCLSPGLTKPATLPLTCVSQENIRNNLSAILGADPSVVNIKVRWRTDHSLEGA